MSKRKRCGHRGKRYMRRWIPTLAGSLTTGIMGETDICVDCGEWFGLGKANDTAPEVAIERRAAELVAFPSDQTILEWAGERNYIEGHEMPTSFGGQSGWLAAAISEHDASEGEG
jgi:hypothetical protein